jgi:hypothetical protein
MAFGLLAPAAVHAGGALIVASPGVPYVWDTPISYNPDQGPLGLMTNADAVAFAAAAFGAWAAPAIPTSSLSFVKGGSLPVDVDTVAEFNSVAGNCGDGLNPVIFDASGSLFTALGFSSGVIGFAGPSCVTTSAPFRITKGMAALNGKWRDGNQANGELTADEFFGTFVHEFGHFLNLDHSQTNGHFFLGDTNDPGFVTFGAPLIGDVEVMFPFALDGMDPSPKKDDAAAISWLYPSGGPGGFFASTGTITGRVLLSDGLTALQGADVIARNVDDPFGDAVSNVSGARFTSSKADATLKGLYELFGLTPGASYAVEVVRVNPSFVGGSGVGPLSPPVALPGPEEFYNGAGETGGDPADDPLTFVPVESVAGVPVTGIDIVMNGPTPVHDLAVTKITAPRAVRVSPAKHLVKVRIQNRSAHAETVPDQATLGNLVTLDVLPIGGPCAPRPVVSLRVGSPQRALPVTLAPKASLDVAFDVILGCANDPARGAGHEDYRYVATVHHSALAGGRPDSHPEDDTCPHDALPTPGHRDPYPDGRIVDRGCGSAKPGGLLGGDVKTDVFP